MRTRSSGFWVSCSLACFALLALTSAPSAHAQIVQEGASAQGEAQGEAVPPPPSGAVVVEATPAQTQLGAPVQGQAQAGVAVQAPQSQASAYAQPVYQPTPQVYPTAEPLVPARRRGDRLEDTANAGEIVDLMITTGAYGVFLGNAIVTWSDLDQTFDPATGMTIRSGDDVVRIRFVSTFLGAALSLTGLLAADAPRGVPTTMAMGLRYGVALSAFGGVAFSDGGGSVDGLLAVMAIGGIAGMGLGAGLGFGLRPHPSRSRFVESGILWGTTLGGMLGGAFGDNAQHVFGGMLAGSLGAIVAHSIIAAMVPVHVGRGWLMNGAFAVGCGLAAFLTWGFGGSSVSGDTYLATMSATGFVALAVVFALTDFIQDSGWDESELPEVVRNMQIDVAPTQGGAVGTIRTQF